MTKDRETTARGRPAEVGLVAVFRQLPSADQEKIMVLADNLYQEHQRRLAAAEPVDGSLLIL